MLRIVGRVWLILILLYGDLDVCIFGMVQEEIKN